jgi:type 1 fimbria pilin
MKFKLSVISFLCFFNVVAQAGTSSATIALEVNVVAEPCVINNGNAIAVEFGNNLLTSQIDGVQYAKTLEYTLDCSNAAKDAVKMKISGNAATFDKTILQASQPALGIKFLSNGDSMDLDNWLNFDRNNPPVLQAIPVKDSGGTLVAGEFTATATMTIDYQ